MIDVTTRLGEVKQKSAGALRAAEDDGGASVVLLAVVREFDSKADKAVATTGGDGAARDAVIELEQAADSAKAAAEADPGLGSRPATPCWTPTWRSASSRPRSDPPAAPRRSPEPDVTVPVGAVPSRAARRGTGVITARPVGGGARPGVAGPATPVDGPVPRHTRGHGRRSGSHGPAAGPPHTGRSRGRRVRGRDGRGRGGRPDTDAHLGGHRGHRRHRTRRGRDGDGGPAPPRLYPPSGATADGSPWVVVLGAVAALELGALAYGDRLAFPTVSYLAGPHFVDPAVRLAGYVVWISVGYWLVRR